MAELTLQRLKDLEPNTIFASGTVNDSVEGINVTGSGKELRWVAVRGGIHDWAIYVGWDNQSEEWIKSQGDKVHDRAHVTKLVPADEEALAMYRD